MKTINLPRAAQCGTTSIPAGEYTVSIRMDSRQIVLEGNGRDIEINAVGRPTKGTVRSLDVKFGASGGGNNWALVVKTPKMGEFFATISYEAKRSISH
jgi:hypothetical protein